MDVLQDVVMMCHEMEKALDGKLRDMPAQVSPVCGGGGIGPLEVELLPAHLEECLVLGVVKYTHTNG